MALALIFDPNDDIHRFFHCKLLSRLGINRNIPKVLIAVPFYMGGFQLKGLELEQTIESISIVIICFNSPLSTVDLMKHSLEYIQLESGWDSPILLTEYSKLYNLCTDG